MPINSIYYASLSPFCPLSLLSAKPAFVFLVPNGRRYIYFQPSASEPTGFLVFNLHVGTGTERRNPIAIKHAILWEESSRKPVKQWASREQGSKLCMVVGRLYH